MPLKSKYLPYILFFGILSMYVLYSQLVGPFAKDMEVTVERHERLIAGNSEFYNPWQYRILSHLLLEGLIRLTDLIHPEIHTYIPFYLFKFVQSFLIFWVAYMYYRKLGLTNDFLIIAGLIVLCYNFSSSTFKADLAFNTYTDILCYLVAGYLILAGHFYWVILVVFFAALNRETSGMIPILLIVWSLRLKPPGIANHSAFYAGIISLSVFVVVFLGLRYIYGFQPYEANELKTPWDFLKYNFSFIRLYPNLLGTWSIIPLLALWKYKKWTPSLQQFGIVLIPVWILVHFMASIAVETRLFLIPQVMVFVPSFLYIIQREMVAPKRGHAY